MTGLLHPWHGLEVAMKLSSIDWNLPDFQQVLKGQWTYLPVVSSCMAIQLTCQSKSTYVSKLMAQKRCSNDVGAVTSTKDDSNITLSFYSPHCIAFSSRCSIDIHSVCPMIEAINASGYHWRAMCLTVAISYAPSDADLSFLTHLGQHVSQGVATPSPAPQSSLSRVMFHHLFKSSPAALSKTLSEQQHVGLKAALNVLSHVNKFTVTCKDSSPTWNLFEYANWRRLWSSVLFRLLRTVCGYRGSVIKITCVRLILSGTCFDSKWCGYYSLKLHWNYISTI